MFEFEIDIGALPQEEQSAALHIRINLKEMRSCVIGFSHSLDLCRFALGERQADHSRDATEMFAGWIGAAVRNGAQMAYAFERMMEAINKAKVPTVRTLQDKAELELATALFAREFPHIGGIRTSAAHPTELGKSAEEIARHAILEGIALPGTEMAEGGRWTFVSNFMSLVEEGILLTSTVKGKEVSYELSLRKLQALDQVLGHFTRSFYPLENPELVRIREEWTRTGKPPWASQSDRPPSSDPQE